MSASRYHVDRRVGSLVGTWDSPRFVVLVLRLALALAFLSAVADRFGLWGASGAAGVVWGSYAAFLDYAQLLMWPLPRSASDVLATLATVIEVALGIGLLAGLQLRVMALASAGLLLSFALSMTWAFGPKPALDYSVLTAFAASLALARLTASKS